MWIVQSKPGRPTLRSITFTGICPGPTDQRIKIANGSHSASQPHKRRGLLHDRETGSVASSVLHLALSLLNFGGRELRDPQVGCLHGRVHAANAWAGARAATGDQLGEGECGAAVQLRYAA